MLREKKQNDIFVEINRIHMYKYLILLCSVSVLFSCDSTTEQGGKNSDSLEARPTVVPAAPEETSDAYAEKLKQIVERPVLTAEEAVKQYEDFSELFVTLVGQLSQKGKIEPAEFEKRRVVLMDMREKLPGIKQNLRKFGTSFTQMHEARLDAADGRMNVALANRVAM